MILYRVAICYEGISLVDGCYLGYTIAICRRCYELEVKDRLPQAEKNNIGDYGDNTVTLP